MSLEEEESKRFGDYVVQNVLSIENPRMVYIVKEEEYNYMKIGCGRSICLVIFNQQLRCNAWS